MKQQWSPKLVTLIEATLSQFMQEKAPLVDEMVAYNYTLQGTPQGSKLYRGTTDQRQLSGMVLDRRRIGMHSTCKLFYYSIQFGKSRTTRVGCHSSDRAL
jgi:hypothetical protein